MTGHTKAKSILPDNLDLDELNDFYARFDTADLSGEMENTNMVLNRSKTDEENIIFRENETYLLFHRINERKACGPDGMKGKVLKSCANQLCAIYTFIFNLSISTSTIPKIWKTSKIIPIPKKEKISTPNDLRPIALTSIVMKCFEKLILSKLNTQLMPFLDPCQFAYKPKRSVEDALLTFTNHIYSHLDKPKSYCRILFIDFSSAFNTIQPHLIIQKLSEMKIHNQILTWVSNFLRGRVQYVEINGKHSRNITTNTGVPQGCVISPILFTTYTNDCTNSNNNTPLIKFADDTAILGLITNNCEYHYRSEINNFVGWCENHSLHLNVSKTKEMIIDFRRNNKDQKPIIITNETVEQVQTYKYLGVTVDNKFSWEIHTKNTVSKMNKRMYFLRKLSQFQVNLKLKTMFFKATIESLVSFCITVWGGNSRKEDKGRIDRIIKIASKHTTEVHYTDDILTENTLKRIHNIANDPTHPLAHQIHKSTRSNRYISIKTKTERHLRSFLPTGIRLLNKPHKM